LVNEYRRTWAQIVGGFGLLLGLYYTWRRIEISQRELEATRDQQVTERFTRAIDQLGAIDDKGNKKLEIRLGGIYALERIALDSLAMETFPGRDYSTVIEVLTAYVRENTPQTPEPSNGSSDETSTSNEATAPRRIKEQSSLLRQSDAFLLLTSKRSWMCSDAHGRLYPRNTVLASIFMNPTSQEPTSTKST
jgi:hypothetical protein